MKTKQPAGMNAILLALLFLAVARTAWAANPMPIHQWQYTDIVRTGIDKVNSNATAAAWLTFSTNWNGSNQLQATDKFIGFSSPGLTNGIFLITASNLAVQLGQWITNVGGAGGGDVTTAQLNAASNVLRSLTIANDTTTSNGLTAIFVANDTTTSNALRTLLVANDTTTSNGLVTLVSGNITTTSNGLVSFTMTASNTLRGAFVANVSGLASNLYVGTATAGTVPLNVKGAGGQGQNLLEVRNSGDVILFQVASNGVLVGTGGAGPRLLHSSTAGYVWTASGTDGTGQWSPITGGGDVTTAQLNTSSNFLSSRIDLALTNSETRKVTLTTNLTVQGRATNQNGLTVLNAPINLVSTNGTTYLLVQEYGTSFPQLLLQNDNGTEATPTPLSSGSVVGQLELNGFGDTIHKTAFNIRPTSLATFGDSQSSTLVRFGIGDDAGTVLGKNMANWTAYNITNNVNVYFKSNVVADGAALFNGSLTALGAGGFLSTLSALGTFQANTNAIVLGTNLAHWLKLEGGQAAGTFAILDGNTNLVGWISTSAIPTQVQLTAASNVLQAAIDAKAGVIETMTNGVRVRLTTNVNLIAGPNITVLATNNSSDNRTDYYLDAPSSALSDGDKGNITVSGSGTIWTIDDQAVRLATITNIAGFSIPGKPTVGSGSMTEITAGTSSVLGRDGSGALGFGPVQSSQIGANVVTAAKIEQYAQGTFPARSSSGTGNLEPCSFGSGLTLSGGVLSFTGGSTYLISNSVASSVDNTLMRFDSTSGQRAQGSGAVLSDAGALSGLDSAVMTNGLGVGGSATVGDLVITNRTRYQIVHLGNTTNIVLDCSKTNYYIATPSNNFTVSLINSPSTGTLAQDGPFLYLVNTNSTIGYFPTNNLNNIPVNLAPAPSTNLYQYHSNGTNSWMSDGQYIYTGTAPGGVATNVLNVSPSIFDPRIPASGATSNYVWTCTNAATGQGEWRQGGSSSLTTNIDSLLITNQLRYVPLEYNGSNTTFGIALTNNWDMSLATFRAVTNFVGTNLTYNLSNVLRGVSLISAFKGNGSYSNTVTLLSPGNTGTNITWMNWATNGNYDILVRPNFTYSLQLFAERQSNVLAWVTTDDPWVPVAPVYLQAVNAGLSNVVATNLAVRAGATASNATVGGLLFFSTTSFTNLNAASTLSNLANTTIKGHTLTNTGDAIRAVWYGVMPAATVNTNEYTIGFGSQTILDTGLNVMSNGTWAAQALITRTGNTSQHVDARWECFGCQGAPFSVTNVNLEIAQTNGIDTSLFMQSGARRVGALTNNSFRVYYDPAGR